MTVGRMLREISSAELAEWMAFYQLEPFGENRADLRSGIVASTVANVMGGAKSKPSDFMPFTEEKKTEAEEPLFEQDPDAQSRLIMAAIFGVTPEE